MIDMDLSAFIVWILITYILGFFSGYFVRARVDGFGATEFQRIVALLITFIWMLSFAASITNPAYSTPIWIHGIMGAVAGFLFKGDDGTLEIPIRFGGK